MKAPLQINVAQLLKEPIGSTRRYEIEGRLGRPPTEEGGDFAGHVAFLRTDKGILVSGNLSTDVQCTCSRCLTGYQQHMSFYVEEIYYPTIDVNTGLRVEAPADAGFFIDPRHVLDLLEVGRQYALMTTPMKPLCTPTCLGLCPVCGGNRNESSCSCAQERGDPRLASLKQLLVKEGLS